MPIHPTPIYDASNLLGDVYEPIILLNEQMIHVARTARIDSMCKIEGGGGVYIGPVVHVASFCHLNVGGGKLTMEEGSSCGSHCVIVTGSSKYGAGRGCSAVDPEVVVEKGRVIIKRNATLYAGCVVRPNVIIGEGATVAMGSVVLHDVPAGELWGGNPARPLRSGSRKTTTTPLSERMWGRKVADERRFVDSMAELYDWPEAHPV